MRYLLRKRQRGETQLRCQYLYEVFSSWFFKTGELGNFDVFQSFPFREDDIMIIYGHYHETLELFQSYSSYINEKNIAIISCGLNQCKKFYLPKKRIFMAPQKNGVAHLLNGQDFGFSFDVTDAEINLYNSPKGTALEKIACSFNRIQ